MVYKKSSCFIGFYAFIICVLCAVAMGCVVSCGTTEQPLSAPQNVYVDDGGYLVWDSVVGANGYAVDICGELYETDSNRFDVFKLTDGIATYSMRVMAHGAGGSADSEWSCAYDYTVKDVEKWTFSPINGGNEYAISCSDKKSINGKVVVPEKGPYGKPVTKLANNAFYKCTKITGVLLPDSITSIGDSVFEFCTALKRIELSPYTKNIGYRMFAFCKSLTDVELPVSVTEIERVAFFASALESLTIPYCVEKMASSSVSYCENLIALNVDLDNVVYAGDGNCIIRKQDNVLIAGCSESVIPDYVRSIEGGAFSGCKSLQQIDIPSGIKSIGNSAFSNCKSLKEISLPEGITSIGLGMFSGCGSLQTVKLPSTLTKLNPDAFAGCKAVDSVIIDEKNPVYKVDGNCVIRKSDNVAVCGFDKSEIPEYVKIIGSGAFESREISYMAIPEGIEVIESGAFMECPYLEEVVFPSTLKKIGSAAFSDCVNLKRYRLPYGLTEIGSYAFLGCELIENPIAIPETVITVGAGAFYGDTHYICGDELRPDGFHVPTDSLDYWWDAADGNTCAGCTMGLDGCYPYVDTFTYKDCVIETETNGNSTVSTIIYSGTYVSSYIAVPYRKGYIFAGWATERGGEIKFGVTEMVGNDGKTTFKACLLRDEIRQIADGTTLYAVWSPDTE